MKILPWLGFLVAASVNSASNDLCERTEHTLFSCEAGKKEVALCASKDLSKTSGYVQYRVKAKGKLEFEHPGTKTHPRGLFYADTLLWASDDEQQVFFQNGEYTYLIYDRSFKPGPKDASAGVFVFRKGKPLGGLDCDEPSDPMARAFTSSFDKNLFENRRFPP